MHVLPWFCQKFWKIKKEQKYGDFQNFQKIELKILSIRTTRIIRKKSLIRIFRIFGQRINIWEVPWDSEPLRVCGCHFLVQYYSMGFTVARIRSKNSHANSIKQKSYMYGCICVRVHARVAFMPLCALIDLCANIAFFHHYPWGWNSNIMIWRYIRIRMSVMSHAICILCMCVVRETKQAQLMPQHFTTSSLLSYTSKIVWMIVKQVSN